MKYLVLCFIQLTWAQCRLFQTMRILDISCGILRRLYTRFNLILGVQYILPAFEFPTCWHICPLLSFLRPFKVKLHRLITCFSLGPATTAGPTSNPSCSSEVTADSGFVTSPNYPNNYPNEADCSYVMRLASGGRIALEFADFQTEHDDACQYDYVTVRRT